MRILRFNENKKTKKEELDGISTFDVKSLEKTKDDLIGFVDYEEVKDKEIKKVKGDVEVTTPGLKKSIKKFEDFSITIGFGDNQPEEEIFDPSKIVMGAINPNDEECCTGCQCDPCECGDDSGEECCPECDCNPCECSGDEECCTGCNCNPCECEEETGNVIPFGQFI
jgi:hypothetical protein